MWVVVEVGLVWVVEVGVVWVVEMGGGSGVGGTRGAGGTGGVGSAAGAVVWVLMVPWQMVRLAQSGAGVQGCIHAGVQIRRGADNGGGAWMAVGWQLRWGIHCISLKQDRAIPLPRDG